MRDSKAAGGRKKKNEFMQDLTQGPVMQQLVQLSMPLLLSGFLQALYVIVDMIIIGNVMGGEGLSAVSVAGQVMTLLTSFSTGICTGGSVVISQSVGAQKVRQQREQIGTMFALAIAFSAVLFLIVGVIFAKAILKVLQTPDEAMQSALIYLRISCCGLFFMFGYNMLSAILRGMGNTKFALYMVIISVGMNVVLDLVFVAVFSMGTAGVALATIISQGVSMAAMFIYLRAGNKIAMPGARQIRIMPSIAKDVLRIGLPSAAQAFAVFFSMLVVSRFVNGFGLVASSAYGIGMKIDNLSTLPRQAVATAGATMVGQNMGAKKKDRMKLTVRDTALISLGVCLVIAVLVWIFAPWLARIFVQDEEIIEEAVNYLRIACISYPITGLMGAFNCLTIGIGFTLFTFSISFLDSCIVRISLCYGLAFVRGMGLTGIYWGIAFAPAVAAFIGFCYFRFGKWGRRAGVE